MRTMILTILFLFLFSRVSSTSPHHHHHHHNRRILHQPLFPRISVPPAQPPTSSPETQPKPQQQQQPKLPFSSTSTSPPAPPKTFFPTYHSPPLPPSPTVVATFPANISSLLLPRPNTPKHRPTTAIAVSLTLFSLSLLLASAAFAYHRHRSPHTISSTAANDDNNDDDKASIPDNHRLFPPNTTTSDAVNQKRRGKSSSGSEVFYLGTMAGSEGAESSCGANDDFRQRYLKLGDSPELNPLPPLPRHNFMAWSSEDKKKEEEEEEEEEEEQFYSPYGSSPRNKQQSPSFSPPVANAPVAATSSRFLNVYKFGSRSFTSRTPSYPHSNSFSRSSSLNLSPADSVKSLPPQNPASPSFSSSPKVRSVLSLNSQANKLPPPPPPLPPRFWETPVVASSQDVNVVGVRNDNENENEETTKPKLKALHWDKVKASSDRAMVWDRLRPSSFQ